MKIICVGRNYTAHIEELQNEKPDEPLIFMKPDTALLKNNAPFYYPGFSKNIHFEGELFYRISREGKYVEKQFARKYFDKIGLGIDFTARDLQNKAKEKSLPWLLSKGFNGAAPVSAFHDFAPFAEKESLSFTFRKNGEIVQEGNTEMMLWQIEDLIAYISRFVTLKVGDLIFTGTPAGVGPVKIGDVLEGFLEGEKVLETKIK